MSAYSANVISEEFRELKVMAVAYVSLGNQIFSIKEYPISFMHYFVCAWGSLMFFLCYLTAKAGKQYISFIRLMLTC